jgi:hypothetical protein
MKSTYIQKIIILGILFLFADQVWAEDWTYYDTSLAGTMYYDKSSIFEAKKGVLSVWTKNILSTDSKKQYYAILKKMDKAPDDPSRLSYYKNLMEIDCTNKKFRYVHAAFYDEQDNIIYASSENETSTWNAIEPDSVGEKLINLVSAESVPPKETIVAANIDKPVYPKETVPAAKIAESVPPKETVVAPKVTQPLPAKETAVAAKVDKPDSRMETVVDDKVDKPVYPKKTVSAAKIAESVPPKETVVAPKVTQPLPAKETAVAAKVDKPDSRMETVVDDKVDKPVYPKETVLAAKILESIPSKEMVVAPKVTQPLPAKDTAVAVKVAESVPPKETIAVAKNMEPVPPKETVAAAKADKSAYSKEPVLAAKILESIPSKENVVAAKVETPAPMKEKAIAALKVPDKKLTAVKNNQQDTKAIPEDGNRKTGLKEEDRQEYSDMETGRKTETREIQDQKGKLPDENRPGVPATARETARDGRFIAFDNQTVLDTKTNLIWAAKDNGRDINWYNAKKYCESYSGGGYTDWRMPTQDELAQLYDAGKAQHRDAQQNPLHLTELIRLTDCCPWSSKTRGSEAAYFDFTDGTHWWFVSPGTSINRAIPVRSAK